MASKKDRERLNMMLTTMEMKRLAYQEAQATAFHEWEQQAIAFCDANLVMLQPQRSDGDLFFIYHMGYKQCMIAENGVNIGKLKKPNGLNLLNNSAEARRLKRAYYALCVDPWLVKSYEPPGYRNAFNFVTRTPDPRLPKRIADMWLRYST